MPKPFASFETDLPREELLTLVAKQIRELEDKERITKDLRVLYRFPDQFTQELFFVQDTLRKARDLHRQLQGDEADPVEVTIQILEQGT